MDEQTVKGSNAPTACHQERNICTSNSIACLLLSGTEHVTSNAFGTPLKQRCEDDRLFFVFENAITPIEPLVDLPSGHCYDSNTDLASIAMRNKETELYRNGWTQRVHAIEQNRPIGNLPLHEQNDGHSQTKNELIVGDGGIMKQSCALTSPKVDNMEKSKEMMHCDSSCDKGGIVRFFRRALRRRAKDDHIETITCGTTDKPAEAQVLSVGPPNSEVFRCSHDDMTESDENPSKVIGEEAQKDSNSHFAPVSTKDSNTVEERKHHPDISSENEDPTSHLPVRNVQNDTDSSEVLIEESMQTKYEQKLPDASDVSICKTNLETVDVPLVNTDSKDEKPSETVGTPIQAVNDRLLKYTFRRKRKRLPLSSHNEDCPVEKKNTSRRNSGDKQGPLPELQKPTLAMESSRDSRRLVQVARQVCVS